MLRQRRDGGSELWISALPFFTSAVLLPALPEFKRRNPALTLRIEATHQYADFNASRVDVAIRYGRETFGRPEIRTSGCRHGIAGVCASAGQGGLARARRPVPPGPDPSDDATAQLAGLAQGGRLSGANPARPSLARQRARHAGGGRARARRHARDGAADQGTAGIRQKLVAPFAFEAAHCETIYLVSRTEQARDRRIAAVRRWIIDAVGRAKG